VRGRAQHVVRSKGYTGSGRCIVSWHETDGQCMKYNNNLVPQDQNILSGIYSTQTSSTLSRRTFPRHHSPSPPPRTASYRVLRDPEPARGYSQRPLAISIMLSMG
jgi:hypothetical protein